MVVEIEAVLSGRQFGVNDTSSIAMSPWKPGPLKPSMTTWKLKLLANWISARLHMSPCSP